MINKFSIIALSLLCLVVLSCDCAYSIPAFARREGVMCQMCHFRMPELNKDGHDYARRGLREEPSSGEMEMEATRFGKTEIPANIGRPLGVPLNLQWSHYLTVMGHHMFDARTHERPVFDAGALDIWAAGPLNPNWSGLANPSFDIQQGGSDVDQAYGQYITRWANSFGSGRFGQLQPLAILFNQGGPKMALSDPLILSMPADTGYGWTPESDLRGLELGVINLSRATMYLGIVQPKPEDTTVTNQPAFQRHTDFYGSAEWIFTDNGDSLTLYAYSGSAWLSPTAPDSGFHRWGSFGNVYGSSTKATVGFLAGSDDDATGRSLDNSGYFALVEQLLSERWAAYLRYDRMRLDRGAGGTQTLSGPAIGVSWWAQTQIRLTFEGQFVRITGEQHENRFMSEFMWAF